MTPPIWLVGLATLTLLTGSADHKPILLVADDAQWLDEPARDVLSFVSRRLGSDPIVLLLAVREGFDLPFGDADTLRHVVPPLGDEDAARLLDVRAPGLSGDLRSRFLREAAGNPLALVELPRAIQAADDREARWLPLTERLEREMRASVRRSHQQDHSLSGLCQPRLPRAVSNTADERKDNRSSGTMAFIEWISLSKSNGV